MKLYFHYKGIKPEKEFRSSLIKESVKEIIGRISTDEKKEISSVSIIFCSDKVIKEYNKKYLGHNYETDIITFHDKDENGITEGELLISAETVKNNSERFRVTFQEEIYRVIIHGILHLFGYMDSTTAEKKAIRKRENKYLKQK